jgi:fibronectin type 3 domain-containing protein
MSHLVPLLEFNHLSWNPSTSTVAGYDVYRGDALSGLSAKVNSSLVTETSYMDTSVQAGQTYYYFVVAVDSHNNESVPSNLAQATIPSP